jgi:penicillin amidase
MTPGNPRAAAAVDLLQRWDGRMGEGEAAPLIFTAWLRDFERALFADRLGDAFPDYWEQLRPLAVEGMLKEYTEWCSDPAAPNRDSCGARLSDSLDRALEQLVAVHGGDMTQWRWGADHVATFAHPVLSRVPVLRDLFAVEIAAPGGYDTINRGATSIGNPDHPYRDVHGAGLRMLLDFADLDRSRFIIVPGQSGNPLSRHYGDLLHPWHDFAWLTLAQEAEGSLLLLEPQ